MELVHGSNTISPDKFMISFGKPTIHCIEFKVMNKPDDLVFKTESINMSIDIDYCYSLDSGESWSRWYNNASEKSTFISLVTEEWSKEFEIVIKTRFGVSYARESDWDDTIQDELTYVGISEILCGGEPVTEYFEFIQSANKIDFEQKESLFDPYANMGVAFDIQRTAAYSINQMFGHWCYYFKTDPDESTRNVTLKSYHLHNVTDMKRIKISVPNNTFPSLRNVYSEWGFQLTDEFNVHVLCDVFENAFGLGAFPHTNDYIYIPLTGKMYSVNAYFKNANFMQRAVYHELTLVKYENDNVVKKDEEIESDTIDFMDLTDITDIVDKYETEIEDSDPVFLNTELLEAYRTKINKAVEIVEYPLYVQGLKLFDNRFLMSGVKDDVAVEWDLKKQKHDDICLYGWFCFEKLVDTELLYITDTKKKKLVQLCLRNKTIELLYNSKSIATDVQLTKDTTYAIVVNVSNVYRSISISIFLYDDRSQKIVTVATHTEDITPNVWKLKTLTVLGGQYLLSGLGIDNKCYFDEAAEIVVTRVTPDPKVNILYDKAHAPIAFA